METRRVSFNKQIHMWAGFFWLLVCATFIMLQLRIFAQNPVWSRGYGEAYDDVDNPVLETHELSFFIAGHTYSITGTEDFDIHLTKAYGAGESDWFLTHNSSGYQKSCRWLVDNVSKKGDRYGERV